MIENRRERSRDLRVSWDATWLRRKLSQLFFFRDRTYRVLASLCCARRIAFRPSARRLKLMVGLSYDVNTVAWASFFRDMSVTLNARAIFLVSVTCGRKRATRSRNDRATWKFRGKQRNFEERRKHTRHATSRWRTCNNKSVLIGHRREKDERERLQRVCHGLSRGLFIFRRLISSRVENLGSILYSFSNLMEFDDSYGINCYRCDHVSGIAINIPLSFYTLLCLSFLSSWS